MATSVRTDAWRELWQTGQLGRFLLLCLGVWLHAADSLVTATVVPAVVETIGGVAYVGWTIALYQVGGIVAGAATAPLCRGAGIRRMLGAGALVYGAGCVLAAAAPDMAVLLAGRLVQGAGGGVLLTLSYVAIEDSFPEHLWSRLFGIVAAIWGVGALLGPLVGGVFADLGLWRGAFWFFAIQAAALWAMALALLPPEPRRAAAGGGFPLRPLLVLSLATVLVAEAGVTGRVDAALALCVAGLALLYVAARLDRRASLRLVPAQALAVRHPVGAGLLMVFALSVGTTGFWAYGPLLLKAMFGTDPLVAGYILAGEALAWSAATMAVATAPAGADRMLIRVGGALVAAAAGGFALVVPAGSFGGMIACALLQGLGFGLCWPSIVHRGVRFADAPERGLAAAAPGTVQRIGYGVGAAASGIAANMSGLADGISASAAQVAGFWVFAGFVPVLAVGLLGAWWFTGRGQER